MTDQTEMMLLFLCI